MTILNDRTRLTGLLIFIKIMKFNESEIFGSKKAIKFWIHFYVRKS